MEYEICKKLKDAGFPQEGKGEYLGISGGDDWLAVGDTPVVSGRYYSPTLSELIEACGEDFYGLFQKSGGWLASSFHKIDEKTGIARVEEWYGETPEIAVAKLWLALNKKP